MGKKKRKKQTNKDEDLELEGLLVLFDRSAAASHVRISHSIFNSIKLLSDHWKPRCTES